MKPVTRKQLQALVEDQDWLGVALKLRETQEQELHTGSFRKWVEAQELFSYRIAMFLIQMANDMDHLGYTQAQVRQMIDQLGRSKTWIVLHHMRRKQPATSVIEQYSQMANPQIEARLKKDDKINFSARISADNYARLVELLKKHGMRDPGKGKARGSGPAFDAFLTRYFKSKR